MRLVLGSASPRRREILAQLGLVFDVVPPAVDETPAPGEGPAVYLRRIVAAKLADVTCRVPKDTVVLAADTEVLIDGTVLGKPPGDDDARTMLERLSGRAHEVVTVFAIRDHVEEVRTTVFFRALAKDEIDAYVASGEGHDKAGAYAIQGRGAMLVSRIEGSYSNVVGLPACEVWVALRRFLRDDGAV
jgi:septum formation protein